MKREIRFIERIACYLIRGRGGCKVEIYEQEINQFGSTKGHLNKVIEVVHD